MMFCFSIEIQRIGHCTRFEIHIAIADQGFRTVLSIYKTFCFKPVIRQLFDTQNFLLKRCYLFYKHRVM